MKLMMNIVCGPDSTVELPDVATTSRGSTHRHENLEIFTSLALKSFQATAFRRDMACHVAIAIEAVETFHLTSSLPS